MNKVILIGRITKDLEVRKTPNGTSVTDFTLAVNRKTKDGGADFITCQAWGGLADTMATFLHKGSLIGVSGRIQTSKYDGKNGTVYRTDVVVEDFNFLEKKDATPKEKVAEPVEDPIYKEEPLSLNGNTDLMGYSISSDDLPFY